MTKILMVASEATPFAKTGGLADVVGALSATLKAQGEDVAVLMPRYGHMPIQGLPCVYQDLSVWFGPDSSYRANVYRAVEREVPYFLVDCPALYARDGLYGDGPGDYPDNDVRFAVLARVALTIVRHVYRPDIIHCHDWQTALTSIYARTLFGLDPTFLGLPVVLTIHNLGYQGLFPPQDLPRIGLDKTLFTPDCLEFFGKVNLLKGGILTCDAVTTVSPTYAREIQTPELGFGLDGVLRSRSGAVTGILNGADYTDWDPATDRYLAAQYTPQDLEGKRVDKADLLAAFDLPPERIERPLLGMVSRLVEHKGLDLIEEAAGELLSEDVTLVVLGTGDPRYEQFLTRLRDETPEQVGVKIAYDEALAHKIEAGADIFLMPSQYEPCGLNQMYSLHYGTAPVVRATGGLDDTVDETTGFKFRPYTAAAFLKAVRAALAAWSQPQRWAAMMRAGMAKDYSWNASAGQYRELYRRLAERS
jgi:starch synthase